MTKSIDPNRNPPTRTNIAQNDAAPERQAQEFAGDASSGIIAHTIHAEDTEIERGGELGAERSNSAI